MTRRLVDVGDVITIGGVEIAIEPDRPPAAAIDEGGLATLTGEARRERENLRVFAKITRELTGETDLMRLLRLIVDSAVALVGGERGFVLLDDGRLGSEERPRGAPADVERMTVSVARSFDHSDIVVPRSRLSMGIAGRAAREAAGPLRGREPGRPLRRDGERRGAAPSLGDVSPDLPRGAGDRRPLRGQPAPVRRVLRRRPRADGALQRPGVHRDQERAAGGVTAGEERPPGAVTPADRAAQPAARPQGARPGERAGGRASRARPRAQPLRLQLDGRRVRRHARGLPLPRPHRRVRPAGPRARGERDGEGAHRPGDPPQWCAEGEGLRQRELRRPSPTPCSSPRSSGTCGGRSPAPTRTRRGSSSRRTAAPCSSTRSGT